MQAYVTTRGETDTAAAYGLRAGLLLSGTSPLMPLLLLSLSFVLWSWWQLQQVRSTETHQTPFEGALRMLRAHFMRRNERRRAGIAVETPGSVPAQSSTSTPHEDLVEEVRIARMRRADQRLSEAFSRFLPVRHAWLVVVLVIAVGFVLGQYRIRSPEQLILASFVPVPWLFDLVLFLGCFGLLMLLLWGVFRLYFGWVAVDELSTAIAEWPLYNAFARLPQYVRGLTTVGLIGSNDADKEGYAARELAQQVMSRLDRLRQSDPPRDVVNDTVNTALQSAAPADRDFHASRLAAASALSDRSRHLLTFKLLQGAVRSWHEAGTQAARDAELPTESRPLTRAVANALRSCEDYLAFEAVIYIESALLNIRRLALFLLVSLLSAVILIVSYPIEPSAFIKAAIAATLLLSVVVLFVVLSGMSRNALLSRLTGTVPGKLTWDTPFILNIVLFAVVPLMVLASAEFPGVRTLLFSWAEPALRSVVRF